MDLLTSLASSSSCPSFLRPTSTHLLEVSKLNPEMEAVGPQQASLLTMASLEREGDPWERSWGHGQALHRDWDSFCTRVESHRGLPGPWPLQRREPRTASQRVGTMCMSRSLCSHVNRRHGVLPAASVSFCTSPT